MRILLAVPGNLRTVPMSGFVADALATLGHAVRSIDYSLSLVEKVKSRLIGRRRAAETVAPRLLTAIEETRPELFLTIFGANVAPDVLAELGRRGVKSANWWLNDPFQFERSVGILPSYDFAFTNARYSVEAYAARGVRNVRFWTFNVADVGITIGAVLLVLALGRWGREVQRG